MAAGIRILRGLSTNKLGFTGILVVIAALCIWVQRYVRSLSDPVAISRVDAAAAAIAAIAALLGLVVLVKYTIETRLLRQVSEKQFEGKIKPIVLLEIESGQYLAGQRRTLKAPRLRNIGIGPAFNVEVAPIVGNGNTEVIVEPIHLIESQGDSPAAFIARENNQTGGLARDIQLLEHLFASGRFPDKTPLLIACQGLSGKHYHTHQLLRYEPATGEVRTEFVRVESSDR